MIEASLVLFDPFLDLRELPVTSPGSELLCLLELHLVCSYVGCNWASYWAVLHG